jgi:hypothetical protein
MQRVSYAGARIRTWELLREQILSLPPLAARPPRRDVSEGPMSFMVLPSPRRRGRRLPLPRGLRRGPPRRAWRGNGSLGPSAPVGVRETVFERAGPSRRRGTYEPGDPVEAGSEPCAPRPSTSNNRDSTARDTRARGEHCSASRCAGPAGRSGPRARDGDRMPPTPRERRGRRSVPARSVPSHRCGGPAAPSVSGLGLLAYRTIHCRAGDDGSAPVAVLGAGWWKNRTDRLGGYGGYVGDRRQVPGSRHGGSGRTRDRPGGWRRGTC